MPICRVCILSKNTRSIIVTLRDRGQNRLECRQEIYLGTNKLLSNIT